MTQFKIKELLLIVSGLAQEINKSPATGITPETVVPLFSKIAEEVAVKSHLLNTEQVATLCWAYSVVPD
jgi:hypothetical protein